MVIVFGEILLDIFPDYTRIGGAPFNFAFHLHRLGIPVRFVSRIGRDENGEKIQAFLEEQRFPADDLQVDDNCPTGTVQVTLDAQGSPRFDIRTGVAYDEIELAPLAAPLSARPPALFYFGTLAQRTPAAHARLLRLVDRLPSRTRCFYDINLRPGATPPDIVAASLSRSRILKLSEAELHWLQRELGAPRGEEACLAWLHERYALDTIALTFGAAGSLLSTGEGTSRIGPAPVGTVVDAVGAGDAYAALLAYGHLHQWSADRILKRAAAFAAEICRLPGAVPIDQDAVLYAAYR
ncbi:MAG: carbohydrate kinase [Desulfosarcinaceae bacterium]|nr:carbohydrate kinase [Desulfosarcinaceae bacterium]